MNWFWINVPLMAVFFLAMTGIPLWLVFKHPDTGPATMVRSGNELPDSIAVRYAATRADTASLSPADLAAADGRGYPGIVQAARVLI